MESKELEALRKQILKAGKVRMPSVTISQKMYSNGMSSPIESKNQEIVEIGIDDLMVLVTAEVEKARQEAQLHILRGFRRRDFARDDFYESAIIDRIAKLQPRLQKDIQPI